MTDLVIPISPIISLPVLANIAYVFFLFVIHSVGEPVELQLLHEIKQETKENKEILLDIANKIKNL